MSRETNLQSAQARQFLSEYQMAGDGESWAALNDAALTFLRKLLVLTGVKSIFEFGSGRSTAAFLSVGAKVFCIEDSPHWLAQTQAAIPDDQRHNLSACLQPLQVMWCGAFPVRSWSLSAGAQEALSAADLILIDSPFYPVFREHALRLALLGNDHAVIVLDDTEIPTIARFCDAIAKDNPTLFHQRLRIDVGDMMDVFQRADANQVIFKHTALDVLKGWRRFLLRP